MTYRSLGAWATAGVALWCSLGVLDITDGPGGIVRVAMLPSWLQLAGSVALALLLGVIFARRRPYTVPNSDDTVLPFYGLAALILPFLPWLPDVMPVLRVFAGPGKFLLWAIALAQVLWAALGTGRGRRVATALQEVDGWRAFSLVAVISLAIVAGTSRAVGAAVAPGTLTLMPIFAALVSSVTWMWLRRFSGSVSAATFAWAATVLTIPSLMAGGAMSPDTPASVLVMLAASQSLWFGPVERTDARQALPIPGAGRAVLAGVIAGGLPWLQPVYVAAAVVVTALVGIRLLGGRQQTGGRVTAIRCAALAAPLALSAGAWFSLSASNTPGLGLWVPAVTAAPAAPVTLALMGRHLLAVVADQRIGVLATAPILAITLVGLWVLWRRGGRARRTGVEIALLMAALVIPAAVVHAGAGGATFPGQLFLPAVFLAAAPIAVEYRRAAQHPERRAIYRLLLLMGMGAAVASVAVQGGQLLATDRAVRSPLIVWLSPDWPLAAYAPEFLHQPAWTGLAQAVIWLMAIAGCTSMVTWMATRSDAPAGTSRIGRGLAFTRANLGALLATLLATGLVQLWMGTGYRPELHPEDRSRIDLLDSFDPHARPVAVRYDPWTSVAASTLPQAFDLAARPVAPDHGNSAETAFNAQFALPAGRYRVQVIARAATTDAGPLSGRLGLQAGTWGGSMVEWDLDGAESRQWSNTFDLPADMGRITFAAHGALGAQVRELRVVPYRVVPFLDRMAADDVRAAAPFDRLLFLFHDENGFPDRDGFWVRGGSPTRVSVVSRSGRLITELRLVLRSRFANRVRIEMPDRVWTEDLNADEDREISVKPTLLDGTVRLVLTTESGFYPINTDRGSTDRRYLGCFVRILE